MARKSRKRYSSNKEDKAASKTNSSVSDVSTGVTGTSSSDSKSDSPSAGSDGKNDPEWYARDPQLLRDASRIPFSTPFGADLQLMKGGQTYSNGFSDGTRAADYASGITGICSLKIKPSFGFQENKNDPANVCANSFYTFVRYVNSGRKNYDPADLFIYAATMADIYSFVVWCQRLYNYAFMYSQRNYYVARALIEANGVDPDSLINNLANFRYWLNSFISKVQAFAVPSSVYYFKRRAFMYANVYIENQYGNLKDQLYQFVPDGWFQYTLDTNNQSAGMLHYMQATQMNPGTTLVNVAQVMNTGAGLMSNITGDEDFGLISGDILKSYGANGIILLAQMGDEGGIIPVYDPWVLSQFKNASITKLDLTGTYTVGSYTFKYGDLYQDATGNLCSREKLVANVGCEIHALNRKLVSVENPDPAEGDVIEGTRLTVCMNTTKTSLICGTELVVDEILTVFRDLGTISNFIKHRIQHVHIDHNVILAHPTDATIENFTADINTNEVLVMQFKYAPITYVAVNVKNGSLHTVENMYVLSNIDNHTIIEDEQLIRLHECALLSLFYVPGVAKLI